MSTPVTMIRLKPEIILSLSTMEAKNAVGGETAFNDLVENYGLKPWRGVYHAQGVVGNKGVLWSVASIQNAIELAEADNLANQPHLPRLSSGRSRNNG